MSNSWIRHLGALGVVHVCLLSALFAFTSLDQKLTPNASRKREALSAWVDWSGRGGRGHPDVDTLRRYLFCKRQNLRFSFDWGHRGLFKSHLNLGSIRTSQLFTFFWNLRVYIHSSVCNNLYYIYIYTFV